MIWVIIVLMIIGIFTSEIGKVSFVLGILAIGCLLLSGLWGWAWLVVFARILLGLMIILIILGIISAIM